MRLSSPLARATVAVTIVAAALVGAAASATAASAEPAVPRSASTAAASPSLPGDNLPFASATFKATHNSYEGGDRGSITHQLAIGSRFVEFDVWDTEYWKYGDYRIGHNWPGNSVAEGNGNPSTDLLKPWLRVVANWSAAHPTHAPITVMIDLKNNASGNNDIANGNLVALNNELKAAFASMLVPAKSVSGALGTVGSLRGKVLTLISGNSTSRLAYKQDLADDPAVAMNASGQVVEVDSWNNSLYYWSGQLQSNGTILWRAHGSFDNGITPAVAINAAGRLVEVHQSQSSYGLWTSVGTIRGDGEIAWTAAREYDRGTTPTVAFTGPTTIREIHRSQSHDQNWYWNGTLAKSATYVVWHGHGTTSQALFHKAFSSAGGNDVSVLTGGLPGLPSTVLRYTTNRLTAGALIRYEQVAFVEVQPGEGTQYTRGAIFYGGPANDKTFIINTRRAGFVARGWDFDSIADATTPAANFPATNDPSASWYTTMLARNPDYVSF